MTQTDAPTAYLAGRRVSEAQLDEWAEQFLRHGFLLIENVLPPETTARLRADLDDALAADGEGHQMHYRMFETSSASLDLFDLEPIASLAERLLGPDTHVISNNSWRNLGWTVGDGAWHQDHFTHFRFTDGARPANIVAPPLWLTCNYYLTDVTDADRDGTEVVPGSHLFGQAPPRSLEGTEWEDLVEANLAPEGSVVIFDNQTWHRGAPASERRVRYISQVAYGGTMVAHRFYPYVNYVMPEHCYRDADERRRRLLGFLPRGNYS